MGKFVKTGVILGLLIFAFSLGWLLNGFSGSELTTSFKATPTPKPRPLKEYTISKLSEANVQPGELQIDANGEDNKDYSSRSFKFKFDPNPSKKDEKTTSGQINLPNDGIANYPVVIMLRGYVDPELYSTGVGTKNAASYFASQGMITVAPDFLGYADSDKEADDIFETRFQTYVTVLSLLQSVNQIPAWDKKHISIWAHSNGGQIALTVLEITGSNYPTVLWAPVSKPFPYSILYYTDEPVDGGKYLRQKLSEFEELYDTDQYSFTKYLDKINAPLSVHQGTSDDAVPYIWSDNLVETLESLGKEVEYHTYPGANHNLNPAWNAAVESSLQFFKKHINN
ncbi:hypothetical protein A2115_00120 [Candidatus Woesebacteria bacterium GWA1_41_8]|jgi:dipeptidyl aminopeptidase/acylaminoacyl peptidase|uniref:Peptidase S9 prolyl oligopeptidase catalytic domain-containing protein n=1 Tax=Candidatus Woesebacteria bacterium GWA1_41_8 TaxID=1802471 RepID=A0A1F7WJ77_9BACT|nr:MAG: hypothetical protein A2115_00120 [Candidatus Woesebacteria bacterium GWA1_41_8]